MTPWDTEIRQWQLDLKLRGSSASTLRTRGSLVRHMAAALAAEGLEPAGVTTAALREHVVAENDQRHGAGPATYYASLRSFWSWWAAEYEAPDPMARVPRPPCPVTPTQVLTDAQLAAIRTATAGRSFLALRNRLIVLMLAGTGIRRGELCGITLGDFTEDSSVVRVSGKTGQRVALLAAETQLALARYLAARQGRAQGTDALLISPSGRALSPQMLSEVLTRLGEKAGVKGLRAHWFRHLWAHRVQAAGMDLVSILTLGGWSGPEQLVKRYGAALRETRAIEAARRLSLDAL